MQQCIHRSSVPLEWRIVKHNIAISHHVNIIRFAFVIADKFSSVWSYERNFDIWNHTDVSVQEVFAQLYNEVENHRLWSHWIKQKLNSLTSSLIIIHQFKVGVLLLNHEWTDAVWFFIVCRIVFVYLDLYNIFDSVYLWNRVYGPRSKVWINSSHFRFLHHDIIL